MSKLNSITLASLMFAANLSYAAAQVANDPMPASPASRPAMPAAVAANPVPADVAIKPAAPLGVAQPSSLPDSAPKDEEEDFSDDIKAEKEDEYKKVVDEYKSYLANVKGNIVEEVRTYRIEIAKINKKKKALYKSLSQEAQEYLAKEAEMKRKLPVNKRKLRQ